MFYLLLLHYCQNPNTTKTQPDLNQGVGFNMITSTFTRMNDPRGLKFLR